MIKEIEGMNETIAESVKLADCGELPLIRVMRSWLVAGGNFNTIEGVEKFLLWFKFKVDCDTFEKVSKLLRTVKVNTEIQKSMYGIFPEVMEE